MGNILFRNNEQKGRGRQDRSNGGKQRKYKDMREGNESQMNRWK